MNLKDRMKANSVITEQTKKENFQQNSSQQTSSDTMKRLNQPSLESVVEAQSEAIQKLTAENHLKDETIEDLRNQTQIDLSEMSELRSVIAELRAEISSVQNVNQSIVKENDDLRNSAGLMSRKEQQKLVEKLTTTQDLLSDTKKLVNMSNVTAVENAQAAKQAAELKAKKEISYYKELANDKISDAISKKNDAISKSKKEVALAKKHEKIAWGSLLATLFCCLIAYPTFLYDIGSFILEPISWIMEALNDYAAWLEQPYYSRYVNGTERLYAYSLGMTWLLRVTSLILITSLTAGGCYGIFKACLYYKSRWCSLSLKVLLVSLAVIIVFGDSIRRYVPINLVLLLILVQAAYIGIIIYLDLYFENRGEWVHWDELQNQ